MNDGRSYYIVEHATRGNLIETYRDGTKLKFRCSYKGKRTDENVMRFYAKASAIEVASLIKKAYVMHVHYPEGRLKIEHVQH